MIGGLSNPAIGVSLFPLTFSRPIIVLSFFLKRPRKPVNILADLGLLEASVSGDCPPPVAFDGKDIWLEPLNPEGGVR